MAKWYEESFTGLGNAVADVREKYEEAVWGRAVTERGESPQWPEAREAEPQPTGLSGEILGLDAQPMHAESSPQWPQAREALTYNPEQERDRTQDMDMER